MATLVTDLDLMELNPHETLAESDAAFAEARSKHWLARSPFGYSINSYDHAVGILRDKRWWSAVRFIAENQGVSDPAFNSNRPQSILAAEGEEHTRLRRLAGAAFSPRAADRLRPFMREVVNGLVDKFVDSGRTELMADVCEPYPIPIICELLGAPREDWQKFSRWATDVLRVFNGNIAEDMPLIMKSAQELEEYTLELIATRRADPREDLLTDMIAATDHGDQLSSVELVMMTEAVIVGGTDTTRNQLACSMALFAQHPDQWNLLRERPELAQRAVEETMRMLGAVRGTGRYATEDLEYDGVLFPKGTFVFPSLRSANFNASQFEEPERFDITRESSKPQLTFGSGIHYCLGAALARAELQESLVILSQRMPNLALDGPVVWKPLTFGIWGPERLPLRFG